MVSGRAIDGEDIICNGPMDGDGADHSEAPVGFNDEATRGPGRECLGERLLGSLLDRAHILPPRLVAPLVAQEIETVGGTEVAMYLQDYEQDLLLPLAGEGLTVREPLTIAGSAAGRAFSTDTPSRAGGARRVGEAVPADAQWLRSGRGAGVHSARGRRRRPPPCRPPGRPCGRHAGH